MCAFVFFTFYYFALSNIDEVVLLLLFHSSNKIIPPRRHFMNAMILNVKELEISLNHGSIFFIKTELNSKRLVNVFESFLPYHESNVHFSFPTVWGFARRKEVS